MPRRKSILSDPGPPMSPLPPPAQTLPGLWKAALPVLIVLYLIFAVMHARLVPTGQTGYQNAPDEAAHVVYIRTVASGHLPTRATAAGNPIGYEWHQPPLYYVIAARFLLLGEQGLRFVSILFGVGCLLLIYRAARRLFPNDPYAGVIAAGIAALTPSHIAITSTVNNDSLLELTFCAALVILLDALHGGFTLWRAGWLGLAVGAAVLTKATGLLLLPVVLTAAVLYWRGGESPANVLRSLGWAAVVAVAVCGWWLVRNARLYGEFLPLAAFRESFAGTAQARTMTDQLGGWGPYFLLVAQWTFQSFWAVYGTARDAVHGIPRFLPEQLYLLTGLFTGAVIIGLARAHLRRRTDFTETQRTGILLLFVTFAAVFLSFAGFVTTYFQTQGRYLYPVMLPICLLGALGWRYVIPARYLPAATALLLVVLAAMDAAFLRYVLLS